MNAFQMLSAIGFPLVMAIGGIAAWRMTKNESKREAAAPEWKDTSLDDWRKERDAQIEAKRSERLAEAERTGAGSEEEVTVRHQRIGG